MLEDLILDAFHRRLRRHPEEPLVVSCQRTASVADIDRLARSLLERFSPGEFGRGALVGLAAPNGPGFLAGLLALRRAGRAALLFDRRTPEAERARIARSLGAAGVLDCRAVWPRPGDFSLAPIDGAANPPARLSPEIAVVKLTSGSTGCPRGILTPTSALVADDAALAATMGLAENERILAAIPMSHSYGLSSVAMPALMRRSVLVLPNGGNPFEPMNAARVQKVTFLPTVPAYLQALVKMASPPRAPSSLRLIISAGAPLKPGTAVRFREVYGRSVHVFYGASECGGITFDRTGTAGERGSLGSPVEGVRITLEPHLRCAASGRGTVTVTSPSVALGYLPEAAAVFSGGEFKSRDLASMRGGELYLEGRLDELINVKGKKVNPREVETVLSQLEGVEDVVTLGVCLPGRDEAIVRSFIACRPGHLSYDQIKTWCLRHLSEHKVPRSIVLLERIPRTERGKLDRDALLALAPSG